MFTKRLNFSFFIKKPLGISEQVRFAHRTLKKPRPRVKLDNNGKIEIFTGIFVNIK